MVFDAPGRNFRHAMYPDYKAHRKPMPEELAEQLPRLRELLDAWGVPVLDDPRGRGRRRDGHAGRPFRRDLRPGLVLHRRQGLHAAAGRAHRACSSPAGAATRSARSPCRTCRREYGLEPADLVDVFALSGDKADNIPGAPGVGDKTALKLIQEFGTLDALYAELERSTLTPRLKRVLGENREQVYLSRDLFRIKRDVELDLDWDSLAHAAAHRIPRFCRLLQELGLRRVRQLADGRWPPVPRRGAPAEAAPAAADDHRPSADGAPDDSWADRAPRARLRASWTRTPS